LLPGSPLEQVRQTARALQGEGRGWTLAAVAVGWFFVLGLRFVVPALLPFITADFEVSNATAGAAITLLWVTYAAMQFPAGALVDRVGERTLLAASTVVSAAGLAGYAVSPSFGLFLAATAAFGLGSGLYGPPRGTVLSRTFPDRDGAAFGAVLAVGSVGAAGLPPLATLVAGEFGWRLAIGLAVPGFFLAGLGLWLLVPVTTGGPVAEADGGRPAPLGTRTRDVLAAIATRRVLLAATGVTLMLFVFQGFTAFFTTYLTEQKGLSGGEAGALFGLLFVSGALAQSTGGAVADRFGHGRVLAAASLFGVLPLLALPAVGGLLALAVVAVLMGVRLSIGPVSNAYIVATLPDAVRGTAWGALRTALFVVGAFGSTVVGAMADRGLFTEAFLLLAGLTAVAGVVYLFLPARESAAA
jgi:predicted MFS family arabinose efflux permease